MVHCHFPFILLLKASHMTKPEVKGWGNILCSLREKNCKVCGKKHGHRKGQRTRGSDASYHNGHWSNKLKLDIDTAPWRFRCLCEYVGVRDHGKESRASFWVACLAKAQCLNLTFRDSRLPESKSILKHLIYWFYRGAGVPLSLSQSCDK